MIDFHTHTFFSDGVLSPAEQVRRAFVAGYKTLGITDHVDFSNIEFVYDSIFNFINSIGGSGWDIDVIPGIEITHVPASRIENIVAKAREMKIPLVIVHGETVVEPVEKGTNRAAIEAGVDILAHPGLILEEDVKRAVELGVSLEISVRRGHSLTNGHVAKMAKKFNARLVLDSDAHAPGDFLSEIFRNSVMYGAGMDEDQVKALESNMTELSKKILLRNLK